MAARMGSQDPDRRARRTGINSLKVGYNRVFGYFIEVTNSNAHLVPADYQRRQTLTGAERYVTPALKEYEERVLTAAERIEERERELFEALRSASRSAGCASSIGRADRGRAGCARIAGRSCGAGGIRSTGSSPMISTLEITGGRHPVVERMMPREKFIPNDVRSTEDARMIILTGPNMAGKIDDPATGRADRADGAGRELRSGNSRARIGVVDRLFTRVGASDNLVRGQSTFMVEMSETSAILHTATRRSLVLLDEIGRGTSTYDGVSIAWSVSEHLHDQVGCKTIFATHYHELTQLADNLVAVRNYNVQVREVGDQVLFLHRLATWWRRSVIWNRGREAGGAARPRCSNAQRSCLRLLEAEQIVPRLWALLRTSARRATPQKDQLALFGLMHASSRATTEERGTQYA